MSDHRSRQAKAAIVLVVCLVAVTFALYRLVLVPGSEPVVDEEVRDKSQRMLDAAAENATAQNDLDEDTPTETEDGSPASARPRGAQSIDG